MYVFVFLLVQDKELDWKIDTYFIFGSVLHQGLWCCLSGSPPLSQRTLSAHREVKHLSTPPTLSNSFFLTEHSLADVIHTHCCRMQRAFMNGKLKMQKQQPQLPPGNRRKEQQVPFAILGREKQTIDRHFLILIASIGKWCSVCSICRLLIVTK